MDEVHKNLEPFKRATCSWKSSYDLVLPPVLTIITRDTQAAFHPPFRILQTPPGKMEDDKNHDVEEHSIAPPVEQESPEAHVHAKTYLVILVSGLLL